MSDETNDDSLTEEERRHEEVTERWRRNRAAALRGRTGGQPATDTPEADAALPAPRHAVIEEPAEGHHSSKRWALKWALAVAAVFLLASITTAYVYVRDQNKQQAAELSDLRPRAAIVNEA